MWDTATWKVRSVLKTAKPVPLYRPQFSPDGKTLAMGAYGAYAIKLFDPATGEEKASFPDGNTYNSSFCWLEGGENTCSPIPSFTTSRRARKWPSPKDFPGIGPVVAAVDGKSFFTRGLDTLTQWSADKGEKLRQWQFPGSLRQVAVTPEGALPAHVQPERHHLRAAPGLGAVKVTP